VRAALQGDVMILGERVRLRPIEREDLRRCVRWFQDPEVRRHLDQELPLSLAQEERWFESMVGRGEEQPFAIEVASQHEAESWLHIGVCGFHVIRRPAGVGEIGLVIGERSWWGRGCGSDAVRTLVRLGFDTFNLHRISLRVFADNARGLGCYEKVGFVREGLLRQDHYRDGAYVDVVVMGLLREDWRARR
jgi:RimJ/RimL family protein N-acetyltransferase